MGQFLAVPVLLSLAAPVPNVEPLYFPTIVGAIWVYEAVGGEKPTEFVEVVVGVRRDGGVTKVSASRSGDNEPRVYEVSQRGLSIDVRPGRQAWELRVGHLSPESWRNKGFSYLNTRGAAKWIDVPAGQFRAIPVEVSSTKEGGGRVEEYTTWYAPGVGMVKRTYADGIGPIVLKSFTPGNGTLPKK